MSNRKNVLKKKKNLEEGVASKTSNISRIVKSEIPSSSKTNLSVQTKSELCEYSTTSFTRRRRNQASKNAKDSTDKIFTSKGILERLKAGAIAPIIEINYKLYAINVHSQVLDKITNVFHKNAKKGQRQKIFVIDIAEEMNKRKDSSVDKSSSQYQSKMLDVALQAIERCCENYNSTLKAIAVEGNFELLKYWKKLMVEGKKSTVVPKKSTQPGKMRPKEFPVVHSYIVKCPPIVVRQHNNIGQSHLLKELRVIEDEPDNSPLYIILIGELSNEFYINLLNRNLPLAAITNLVPSITGYDILIPNVEQQEQLSRSLQVIAADIMKLRELGITKPVGIFYLNAPNISKCEAELFSKDIYSQLSWYHYDIEMLHRQYEEYYFKPYRIISVNMEETANLFQTREHIEALNIQGHHLLEPYPIIATDTTTVWLYLDSLLNTFGTPENMNLRSDNNLASSSFALSVKSPALFSITYMRDIRRLFVEHSNRFLEQLLRGVECTQFRNIYISCLEYNCVYNYIRRVQTPPEHSSYLRYFRGDKREIIFPSYVKFFTSNSATQQRLLQLLNEYGDYEIRPMKGHYRLFHFKHRLNEIVVQKNMEVIPTRLCFRAFSLFEMDDFLKLLVTPNTFTRRDSQNPENYQIDQSFFIRPSSLKASEYYLTDCIPKKKSNVRPSEMIRALHRGSYIGLPPNHRLRNGYNLDDTRQEIHTQNSIYRFKEGELRLYTEHWCFAETNKSLSLSLHQNEIFLNCPKKMNRIDTNIRLVTKNDISIRLHQDINECAKVVLNYPNGLSIYHHDYYVDQLWQTNNWNREKNRIFTSEGVVIVHYIDNEFIFIMRYNGEIYKLIQTDEKTEEEMDEDDMNTEAATTSSGFQQGKKSELSIKTSAPIIIPKTNSSISTDGMASLQSMRCRQNQPELLTIMADQLRFLVYITSLYSLEYLRVLITTSVGQRVYMKRNRRRICLMPALKTTEWHDYSANESYAMRSDGVRMIWTADTLKCYHSDDTLLTTKLQCSMASAYDDELDSLITMSSSHLDGCCSCEISSHTDSVHENSSQSLLPYNIDRKMLDKIKPQLKFFGEECELEDIEDKSYINISTNDCEFQHARYAGVWALRHRKSNRVSQCSFEIRAIDEVNVQYQTSTFANTERHNTTNSEEDVVEEEHLPGEQIQNVLVRVGEKLALSVCKHTLKICVQLKRYDPVNGKLRPPGHLQLCTKFACDLNDTFQDWAAKVKKFQNAPENQIKEVYFIEGIDLFYKTQGFEFFDELLTIPEQLFVHDTKNTRIEFYTLATLMEKMTNNYDEHALDLKKFPRFPERVKSRKSPIDMCPLISSVRLFYAVPRQLQTVYDIHKFLQPFSDLTYKRLRPQLRDAITYFIRPWVQNRAKKIASTKNWQLKKEDHQQRLYREQRMKALYNAMLKFKTFPKYHKFMTDYNGNVSSIDIFDYIKVSCPQLSSMEI